MPVAPWLAVLIGLLIPFPARAEEPAWREPLWLQPPGADAPFPVLLDMPSGWQRGDAAVIVIPDPAAPQASRHRLVDALLAAAALVVELDPVAAWATMPALPPYPALDKAGRPAALRETRRLLRSEVGAGVLVVLGLGQAGDQALAALAEPGLAAAAALGPEPRFRPGAPPPTAEQWPRRVGVLCATLAEVAAGAVTAQGAAGAVTAQGAAGAVTAQGAAGAATTRGADSAATAQGADRTATAQACRAALLR